MKLAFVTGATSGIGKALCRLLASKGLSLIITGRNKEELENLFEELSGQVKKFIAADLSTKEGVHQLVHEIREASPDLVINNAGFGLYGDALSYKCEDLKKIVDVNVKAVLELTLEAARTLISNGKPGKIMNLSSAVAFQVAPTMAVYAGSKAFVSQFSQALDQETSSYGVRVLAACPGMVETAFSKRAGETQANKKEGVMSAEYVADAIWNQILRAKPLAIIDWRYRALLFLSSCLPKKWSGALFKNIMMERIAPRPLILRPPCEKMNQ